ncbi:outer membrane protein [Bradyrhizobium iriomotense]|uniref:Membrane protein n=1 Tax=Bradyrhizobium iriomotense TaxID=441950 RepID=A0ABQ6AUM9_9BRAD|nr:outer membrane beta-barrel protein [Bradyrhizobium iriomotense]GLR84694.1 membrane protein [Bradyrhizobium iriomotense]
MRLALAGSLVLLGTIAASAADLAPTYTKAPLVAPVSSWTGFYVGGNLGGDWGRSDQSSDITSAGAFFGPGCFAPSNICQVNVVDVQNAGTQRLNTSGFTGGGQIGYNWQAGAAVFGIEADFDFFRSQGSGSRTVSPVSGVAGTVTVTDTMSTDWLVTLRPRIGWAVNNWLFYGTGGLAVSNLKSDWTFAETRFGNAAAGSVSGTKAGWTVGAGVETKLAGGWSLGLEYLFVHFDNVSATVPVVLPAGGGPAPQNFFHSADLETNIVRAKLNYQFGGPVVAKF